MARHAEGFKIGCDPRSGIHFVRFRHKKRRYNLSTRERDPGGAARQAQHIYAEVISGRWRPGVAEAAARPGTPLDEIAAEWIADIESDHDSSTIKSYKLYVATHLQPFFLTLDRITTVRGNDYWRHRLRVVKRKTILKELSALRARLRNAPMNSGLSVLSPGGLAEKEHREAPSKKSC
jgi:hypothetical protein